VLEGQSNDKVVMAMRIPLDPTKTVLLYNYMESAARSCQMHKHTPTCKKGGRTGDHSDCRMGYDRPLVHTTHCLNATANNVLLRRTHGNLVAYMPVLMLAMPGNHFVSMTHEHGRGLRDWMLWKDKFDKGATISEPPSMLDAETHSIMQSEYASKYCAKIDNTDINTNAFILLVEHEAETRTPDQQAKSLLQKLLHKINGSQTYPLVLTVSFLLGHDDHWFPIPCATFDPWHFYKSCMSHSKQCGDLDMHDVQCRLDHNAEDSSVTISTQLSRYNRRHVALHDWSPYEMTMAFDCAKPTRLAGQLLHLDNDSDQGHNPVANIRIPQIVKDIPPYPAETSDLEFKEEWAAYALGVFFPFDTMLDELEGDSLWEKVGHVYQYA